MSTISKKLRRTLAVVLAFVMVASVAVPSTPAQAAAKKYVKSLKVSPAKVTLTAGAKKTVKATVKVSGKAKKNVTVKSSNKKVVTVKTKKANKKGVSTITLTAKNVTSKKSAKITVTTSAKNKKGKKVKKTINVTVNPKTTTVVKPTNPPASVVKYKVTGVSAINTETGEVTLTFDSAVSASSLAGTTITIKGDNGSTVTAAFSKVSATGNSATYTISAANLGKLVTGNYTITTSAGNIQIPSTIGNTTATVRITGNSVKGFVYVRSNPDITISGAQITIDGSTVGTDVYGFYQKAVPAGEYKSISVKAAGYFDESKAGVKVASNKASAYNFEMEPYDISKIYICGTVVDAEDSTVPVAGATVILYEDGDVKAVLTTDAKGHYVFKNSSAVVKNFECSSVRTFGYSSNIRADRDYRITISKDLSAANLKDVYKEVDVGKINLGSARNINVDTTMQKVKNVGEVTMNLSWLDDTNTVLKTAESTKVKAQFIAPDGETRLVADKTIDLKTYLGDKYDSMTKAYKLASEEYFGAGSSNEHPTLPTGRYYLLVTDLNADSAQVNATTVIPVDVQEGRDAEANGTIAPAVSRTVNYTATCGDNYRAKAMANQGAVLKKVRDNQGETLGANINVTSRVYQVVDGEEVLIRTNTAISMDKTNDTYGNSENIGNLAANQEYSVKTTQLNLTANAGTIAKNSTVPVTINLEGAASVVSVKMKDKNCFVDDEAEGKTAATTETVLVNSVTVTGAGGTYTAPIGEEYTLAELVAGIDINRAELTNLKPGKYKVSLDIDGYKPTSSADDEEDVIDLQDATMVCEAKYEKVYPTTIMGTIAAETIADNGKISADGLAVLYTSDLKNIVAAGNLYRADNGATAYKLVSGEDGTFGAGSYKLIIRTDGIDTLVKDITINEADKIYKNQNFTDVSISGNAGKSGFKIPITTNIGTVLDASAEVTAYDAYYINPFDLTKVDVLAMYGLWYNWDYIGAYDLARENNNAETWTLENISKGEYTIVVDSDVIERTEVKRNINGLNEESIKVPLIVNEDLVRIQLIITNRNDDSFTEGQVDFITVESADGKIFRYGNTKITQQKEEVVYFYVPKNQLYTVDVYSNDAQVGETKVTSQSRENEEIDVTCQKID